MLFYRLGSTRGGKSGQYRAPYPANSGTDPDGSRDSATENNHPVLCRERVKTCGKSARLGHGDIPGGQTLRIVSPCKPVVEAGSVEMYDASYVTSEGWVLQVLSNQYRR